MGHEAKKCEYESYYWKCSVCNVQCACIPRKKIRNKTSPKCELFLLLFFIIIIHIIYKYSQYFSKILIFWFPSNDSCAGYPAHFPNIERSLIPPVYRELSNDWENMGLLHCRYIPQFVANWWNSGLTIWDWEFTLQLWWY